MYLRNVELFNWRKFKQVNDVKPGVTVKFQKGLNLLVGENDSGKTAIIDAIRVCLGSNTRDRYYLSEEDFTVGETKLKIVCTFEDLTTKEQAYYFEWLDFTKEFTPSLRIVFEAELYSDMNKLNKIRRSITGGAEDLESPFLEEARQLLATTYLKPLRDASSELSPGYHSRLSQIIQSLPTYSDNSEKTEEILESFSKAYEALRSELDEPVLNPIRETTDVFFDENTPHSASILSKDVKFSELLRKIELKFDEIGSGLGSSNLLFIALELLLLNQPNTIGPRIALVEEIEAHIHPQAQLRIIKHLENDIQNSQSQIILTTHSTTLSSVVSVDKIIMIYKDQTFSMDTNETKLSEDDYKFLDRFLDATKANLFFAKGVIFVEGDAENLLLPTIAEVVGYPLHRYGISIVNVGSLAFKRYSSIFLRKKDPLMLFPVTILTDLDLKPPCYFSDVGVSYIRLSETMVEEISQGLNLNLDELELTNHIFIEKKEIIEKIVRLSRKSKNSENSAEALTTITKQAESLVDNALSNYSETTTCFQEMLDAKQLAIKEKLFDKVENTKVILSTPWTLEHTLLMSSLKNELTDIILNQAYTLIAHREKMKKKWEEIEDELEYATTVYSFFIDKKISKAICAQLLSDKLLTDTNKYKNLITSCPKLNYLVETIKHAGGMS
ncbi:ATP-dependent nuclease [Enterococcus thailandicus]|uniref:ATP-dependent nuclease n=1 Tax=Enterococcus thailandicus TaxID=417368 RepID=UPI0022E8A700|nr:AAA family ATPase [Enterococcus thailandicus]